ncbi:hypothetical protein Bp8pS_140 [Bacillus phage vB_BpuM-BpSp]|nr:hypothetical protein Bp8pS_140 [Bacillus phage vB_BpuM-BpSp]
MLTGEELFFGLLGTVLLGTCIGTFFYLLLETIFYFIEKIGKSVISISFTIFLLVSVVLLIIFS